MRKFILFAVVALIAVVWTVSVQSASSAQTENCVCVPGPQCDKCPVVCESSGKCDMTSGQCNMTKGKTEATATKGAATQVPAGKAINVKATGASAVTSTECGKQCSPHGCAMASAR